MKRLRPYLDPGILVLDNKTAERAMRSVAVGRKNYLFIGSQTSERAAAIAHPLIENRFGSMGVPGADRCAICPGLGATDRATGLDPLHAPTPHP